MQGVLSFLKIAILDRHSFPSLALLSLVTICLGVMGGGMELEEELLVFGLGSSDKNVAVSRLVKASEHAQRISVPRGLRHLTILSCRGGELSSLGWRADDRAAPVSLDPCIGLGTGSRFHFQGNAELELRGAQRGALERAAYALVDKAFGVNGQEYAANFEAPIETLQSRASRIVWTSEWDASAAAFPSPILLSSSKSGRNERAHSTLDDSQLDNGWLYTRNSQVPKCVRVYIYYIESYIQHAYVH
jgi:hypothetical protein